LLVAAGRARLASLDLQHLPEKISAPGDLTAPPPALPLLLMCLLLVRVISITNSFFPCIHLLLS
jgi:hypothetical protein